MTLLERLQHKRELRRIWKPRKPKKIILTTTQKAENRAAAEGIVIAIQRQIEKELAAEAEVQQLYMDASKAIFSGECLVNVSKGTIYMKPSLEEVQNNVFKFTPRKSSQAGDPKHLR
ncbi:hypothetical protein [Pseudomonas sp. rhizo25]|uniref:hypothetical protein n=1 Tax=Pseudomonas sp. rhizo25 TaxID=3059675 RepID=UPI00288C7BA9|nr:hypothetical protein [Pseudomonas sp. rhizo25]MDT3231246.1 hypothetical protein [Pseudomonas sp. rhizo25]